MDMASYGMDNLLSELEDYDLLMRKFVAGRINGVRKASKLRPLALSLALTRCAQHIANKLNGEVILDPEHVRGQMERTWSPNTLMVALRSFDYFVHGSSDASGGTQAREVPRHARGTQEAHGSPWELERLIIMNADFREAMQMVLEPHGDARARVLRPVLTHIGVGVARDDWDTDGYEGTCSSFVIIVAAGGGRPGDELVLKCMDALPVPYLAPAVKHSKPLVKEEDRLPDEFMASGCPQ